MRPGRVLVAAWAGGQVDDGLACLFRGERRAEALEVGGDVDALPGGEKIRIGGPFQVGLGVAGPQPVSWQIPGDHVVAIPGEGPGHLLEGPGA